MKISNMNMSSLNSILLEGNIEKDIVLSSTPNCRYFCEFTVKSVYFPVVDNPDKPILDCPKEYYFFTIEAWDKLAETVSRYGKKGRGVRIVGRLKENRLFDPDSAHMKSKIVVEAIHVEFRPGAYEENQEKGEGAKDGDDDQG